MIKICMFINVGTKSMQDKTSIEYVSIRNLCDNSSLLHKSVLHIIRTCMHHGMIKYTAGYSNKIHRTDKNTQGKSQCLQDFSITYYAAALFILFSFCFIFRWACYHNDLQLRSFMNQSHIYILMSCVTWHVISEEQDNSLEIQGKKIYDPDKK